MKRPAESSDSDDSDRVTRRVRPRRSLAVNGTKGRVSKTSDEPVTPLPFDGKLPKKTFEEVLRASHPHDTRGYLELKVYMKWVKPGPRFEVQAEEIEGDEKVKFRIEFSGPCHEYLAALGRPFDIGDHLCLALRGSSLREEPRRASMQDQPLRFLEYREGVLMQYLKKKQPLQTGMLVNTFAGRTESRSVAQEVPMFQQATDCVPTTNTKGYDTSLARSTGFGKPRAPTVQTPKLETKQATPSSVAPQNTSGTLPAQRPRRSSVGSAPPANAAVNPPITARETAAANTRAEEPTNSSRSSSPVETRSIPSTSARASAPLPDPPARSASPAVPPSKPKLLYRTTYAAKGKRKRESPHTGITVGTVVPAAPTNGDRHGGATAHGEKKAAKKALRAAKHAGPAVAQISAEEEVQTSVPTAANEDISSPVPAMLKSPPIDPQRTIKPPAQSREGAAPPTASGSGMPVPKPAAIAADGGAAPPLAAVPSAQTVPESLTASESVSVTAKPLREPDTALIERLQAGCYPKDTLAQYPSLRRLQSANGRRNLIGIAVEDAEPKKTKNDYHLRLLLTDASVYDKDIPVDGFRINIFSREELYLPQQVLRGDIVLLRTIKLEQFNGRCVGSASAVMPWSWSLYRPGMDVALPANAFSLSEDETSYCATLSEWWKTVQPQPSKPPPSTPSVNVVHIGDHIGTPGSTSVKPWTRLHRLVKDASPAIQPNGYFDCTVEVLHTYQHSNGVWSVYVTDYTSNALLPPVTTSWAVPELSQGILKIEMWDSAAEVAETMHPGDLYALQNVRMKVSAAGSTEARMSEAKRKIRKLDQDELEGEPHLVELLRRKQAFTEKFVDASGPGRFPHKLFKDAELDKHFDCTAYVLHVSQKGDDRTFIYVTDYTTRTDLADVPATAPWAVDIGDDRIVKVLLSGPAAAAATRIELAPGDYVAMRRLRLKSGKAGRDVSGRLGGEEGEQLLFKLDTKESGNGNLLMLLKRQKDWQKKVSSKKYVAAASRGGRRAIIYNDVDVDVTPVADVAAPVQTKYERLGAFTLKELKSHKQSKGSAVFRPVVARIVDFYPEQPERFVILRCTKCLSDVPERLKVCTKCADSMDTEGATRALYKFAFLLEDELGEQLVVSAGNPEANYLKDLPPTDLSDSDSEDTLEALQERLRPLLGDLLTEHSALIESAVGGRVGSDSSVGRPLFKMEIAARAGESGAEDLNKDAKMNFVILSIDPAPLI